MITRRQIFAAIPAIAALGAHSAADAVELRPYDAAAVQSAIKAGKPVVLHVYAPWCLQCRVQASILTGLGPSPQRDKVAFFRVDYDGQKDVVTALGCPRSTVIAYSGGKEVSRMSWGTSEADVMKVVNAAL